MPRTTSIDELNRSLLDKCQAYFIHQIRGKSAPVGEMFQTEKENFYPLPGYRYDAAKRSIARVDRFSTVRFDTNNYSVPAQYCGQEVTIKAGPEQIQTRE